MSDADTSSVPEETLVIHYVDPDLKLTAELKEIIFKAHGGTVVDSDSKNHTLYPKVRINTSAWVSREWNEARTMLFIREKTSIPVPKVLVAMSSGPHHLPMADPDTPMYYIARMVTEDYPGEKLDELWDRSDEATRRKLHDQVGYELKIYLEELRQLVQDGSYIGSLGHGPIYDSKFEKTSPGPFSTEAEFNAALQTRYEEALGVKPHNKHLVAGELTRLLDPHKHTIVFTHGHLRFRNIVIEANKISAIIGWHWAGWYPSYWEYVSTPYHFTPDAALLRDCVIPRPHNDVSTAIEGLTKAIVIC